jgi:kumamolisin
VTYPASDPSVVTVGGTSLSLNTDNTISAESAWSLSGGGKAKPLLRPLWQLVAQLAHAKYRWAPDVAFLADPQTGVGIFFKGTWRQAGGTSLGAPAWAAIWSLVRESAQQSGKTVGAAPPLLYQIGNSATYAQALHDITVGDNGYYQAGPGWDPVTGWGTPDVGGLATTVQALPAASP